MREARGSVARVGVDGILAPVGDNVDLPLPLGHLGLGHHHPLLVDGVDVAFGVARVEDGVVRVVLLLTAHGGDGGVRDLAEEHSVSVLDKDSR